MVYRVAAVALESRCPKTSMLGQRHVRVGIPVSEIFKYSSYIPWHKITTLVNGGSRMGHLGQMHPPLPLKKLHTRSRYSNRAVNYSNKAVTLFMRQCSLPMKL